MRIKTIKNIENIQIQRISIYIKIEFANCYSYFKSWSTSLKLYNPDNYKHAIMHPYI